MNTKDLGIELAKIIEETIGESINDKYANRYIWKFRRIDLMVKAHGVFYKCVQNSQEAGRITNDKNHMFSRYLK